MTGRGDALAAPIPKRSTPSIERLALGALLLFAMAFTLRAVNVNGVDPWEDEVYTFIGSGNLVPELLTWDGTRSNLHSPLIYIEVKISRALFGNTNLGLRFPAMLYGSLSVVLLYLITGRFAGWTAAFFAGLILALNPFAIEWGRDARMYSQWLFGALVVIGLATEAVRHTIDDKSRRGSPLDWRWWLLGIGLMLVHAWAIFGVTTIAAVAVWLGLLGLVTLIQDRRRGCNLLLGAALSGGVYLCSWAMVGVAKLLQRVSRSKGASTENIWGRFPNEISSALNDVTGYLPSLVSVALWAIALMGLLLLWRSGRGRLALLTLLVGVFSLATFPMIAKQHFFASRYVIIALLPLAIGLGSAAAWAWESRGNLPWLGRASTFVTLGLLVFLWLPMTRLLVTQPRVEYSQVLASIRSQAKAGDALVCLPEWYIDLDPWYQFKGKAIAVMPPQESLIFLKSPKPGEEVPGGYDQTFESVFPKPASTGGAVDQPATPTIPAATWILLVEPTQADDGKPRMDAMNPVFAAYGIDPHAAIAQLTPHIGKETMIICFRVSTVGIDQIHTGGGR